MDGVLVDTYRAHFQSWVEMTRADGIQISEAEFAPTFGQTNPQVIRCFWKDRQFSDAEVNALAEEKEAVFRKIIETNFPAMPGAEQLVAALHQAGFRLAVGSSAPRENVDAVLRLLHAETAFQAVVSGSDVSHGKPDPEVFLRAAERLQLPPSRCMVVEDAPVGVAAATAAGMASIGLLSTGRSPEDLAGARRIVRSLNELSPALFRDLLAS